MKRDSIVRRWAAIAIASVVLCAGARARAQTAEGASSAPPGAGTEAAAAPVAPPTPPPATPAPAPPLHAWSPGVAPWILLGVGVASLIPAIGFGVAALNDQSAFNTNPTQAGVDHTAFDGMMSDIFLGVTVVSAAAAVVLLVEPALRSHARGDDTTGGRSVAGVQFNGNGLLVRF